MNRRLTKFGIRASGQRFVSVFITVIWLMTTVQPCAMASANDSSLPKIEAHHSTVVPSDHADADGPTCPHCDAAISNSDHCDPQDELCDEDESFMYFGRIKSPTYEKFDKQTVLLPILTDREQEKELYRTIVFAISKSLNLPAGPPLIDLYRVYLK